MKGNYAIYSNGTLDRALCGGEMRGLLELLSSIQASVALGGSRWQERRSIPLAVLIFPSCRVLLGLTRTVSKLVGVVAQLTQQFR